MCSCMIALARPVAQSVTFHKFSKADGPTSPAVLDLGPDAEDVVVPLLTAKTNPLCIIGHA